AAAVHGLGDAPALDRLRSPPRGVVKTERRRVEDAEAAVVGRRQRRALRRLEGSGDPEAELWRRQVMDIDGRARTERHRALDHVSQLPDVAGPVVRLELAHRFGGDGDLGPTRGSAGLNDESVGEGGDAGASLPEGGNGQTDAVQTKVEVLPERSRSDQP